MKTVICPNCSGPVEIEDTQSVFTCPYCSVTSEVVAVKEEIEHYMLPVAFNEHQIRTQLIGDILKYPGTPEDLHNKLIFTKITIKFIPYWIISVTNRTEYIGVGEYATYRHKYRYGYKKMDINLKSEQGVFDDEREYIIYAAEEFNEDLIDFEISTRGKVYFQKGEVDKISAELVPSIYNLHQAENIAIERIRGLHSRLIFKEVVQIQQIRDNPQIKSVYLLHVPFYFIEFKVNNRRYQAIMDAATGRTVTTEIPREIKYIAVIVTTAVLSLIIGLIGLFLTVKNIERHIGIYLLITGTVIGLTIAIRGLASKYSETRRKSSCP